MVLTIRTELEQYLLSLVGLFFRKDVQVSTDIKSVNHVISVTLPGHPVIILRILHECSLFYLNLFNQFGKRDKM